jgi:hypothetical protein
MLEAGVPLAVVGAMMGWSPATAAKMAKKYAHLARAYANAVSALDGKPKCRKRPRNT